MKQLKKVEKRGRSTHPPQKVAHLEGDVGTS